MSKPTMTFDEAKERTAADLKKIAELLNEEATAIEAGDLQRMDSLLDEKLPLWFEMLAIRYGHVCEQRGV
jgi:hypothetical protein